MRLGVQDLSKHLRSGRTDGLRPIDQAGRCPLQMLLMRLGAMLVDCRLPIGFPTAHMRGHSLAAVEDLHRAVGQANFDSLADELVGNRVIVALDLNVVVDVDASRLPVGKLIRLQRQGPQSRPVERFEQTGAGARALAEGALVEPLEKFGDGLVELGKAGETVVAERRQDPALDELHSGLDLGADFSRNLGSGAMEQVRVESLGR